jgi:glycerol-3-phosphate dehydrogenase
VTIWARNEETCASITKNRKHPLRFKNFVMPKTIRATSNMVDAVANADLIIHAIPAQHTPAFLRKYRDIIPKEVIFVSTAKGILVETEQLMSEAIVEALGEGRNQPLAYLSGPSFAKEMIEGHPMAVVVASTDEAVAITVQSWLSSKAFRIYHTTDVIGVEVGGAIKNPLAIGAGMANGLGYGQSTLAALVTRGCNELMKLSVAMGGRPETLYGLSGVGDLMLTSFSTLSRNRTLGYRMAKEGLTLEEALAASGEVVEGVATAKVAAKLCIKYNLDLPLFTNLALILEGKITPNEALDSVMSRPLKHEHSGI